MNVEKLVATYLRGVTPLRLVARTPENTDDSWVKVTQLVARQPDDLPTYQSLREYYLQLDCYASVDNGEPEAMEMAETVSSALAVMDEAEHEEGEVTACRIENGGARVPDGNFNPARERSIITATAWVHP